MGEFQKQTNSETLAIMSTCASSCCGCTGGSLSTCQKITNQANPNLLDCTCNQNPPTTCGNFFVDDDTSMTTSSVSSSYTDIFEIIVNFDPYYVQLCWDGRYGSEANYVISSAYLSSAKSFPMKQLQRLNTDIPVPYNKSPLQVEFVI